MLQFQSIKKQICVVVKNEEKEKLVKEESQIKRNAVEKTKQGNQEKEEKEELKEEENTEEKEEEVVVDLEKEQEKLEVVLIRNI